MDVCKEALDKVAPLKQKCIRANNGPQKYIRANNGPFMNKDITKAIIKRTRLRKNYLKNRCDVSGKAYNAQSKSLRFFSRKS